MNAIKFYESNGYYLVVSSGFWSDNRVWIHCAKIKKRLVNKTKQEKSTEVIFYLFICLIILLIFLLFYLT